MAQVCNIHGEGGVYDPIWKGAGVAMAEVKHARRFMMTIEKIT